LHESAYMVRHRAARVRAIRFWPLDLAVEQGLKPGLIWTRLRQK